MEFGTGATTTSIENSRSRDAGDSVTEQRLTQLLELHAESLRTRSMYRSDRERMEASIMTRPIDSKKAFAYFGLMIGALPPFAVVFKIIGETVAVEQTPILFLILLAAAGIGTGVAGYASGRFVPSVIARLDKFSPPNRAALLSLTGFAWGAVSGAIGGLFLFVIGALFGAVIGGAIGAAALPLLVAFRAPLRHGDLIELKHFLPISFGITLSLCAFILGL